MVSKKIELFENKVAVIGLGYVGLPLAIELASHFKVVGFDIDDARIAQLKSGVDITNECNVQHIHQVNNLYITNSSADLKDAQIYIITVPTPIDKFKNPDLTNLLQATKMVGKLLNNGDIVIYESTVFPGATEEICVPCLEEFSGLSYENSNQLNDKGVFCVGYSPERVNPGDSKRRLTDIVKVVSGSSKQACELINKLYSSIISAGTHEASSIKVAEAAKIIENIQRDVNIALINELTILFDKMDIDTREVLDAANTKWNFLNFSPGLVGGHCIGVDPYYLTHKAQEYGSHPELITAGRRVNDKMYKFVSEKIIRDMVSKRIPIANANVLVLGATFKENCPDTRNSKVVDLIDELSFYVNSITIFDPVLRFDEAPASIKRYLSQNPEEQFFDCIVLAVPHGCFLDKGVVWIRNFGNKNHILFDMKYALEPNASDSQL